MTSTISAAAFVGKFRLPPVGVCVSSVFVLLIVISAVAPGLIAGDPEMVNLDVALAPPSASHPLGTDLAGRDLYARIVHGAGQSLLIGIGATTVAMVVATVLGFSAGLTRKASGVVADRAIEVLFAFPALLLALLLVSVFGPGMSVLILAVGVGTAPGYARIIRGQVLAVRNAPYIDAAVALGHSPFRVFRQHVVPNALRPMIVTVTLGIGQSIVWASGLAFLGLGVAPPAPEWGALLDAGRTYITRAWWLELFPGLAVITVALAVTGLGRFIGQRLEGQR